MTLAQQADAAGALKAILSDTPVRAGYVQGLATWNAHDGAAARLEAGERLLPNLGLFVAGTWDNRGPGAEAGWRWTWG